MFDNDKKQQMANVVRDIPENTIDIWLLEDDYDKVPDILAKPVDDWNEDEEAIIMGMFLKIVGTGNLWNNTVQTYSEGLALDR
jgi:hypothetical protein